MPFILNIFSAYQKQSVSLGSGRNSDTTNQRDKQIFVLLPINESGSHHRKINALIIRLLELGARFSLLTDIGI